MKNKLLSNTIYLYILTFVKMLFPLLTLPYLTRVLGVDTYGCVAYIKSYMSYIQLVLDFGFLLSATKEIAIAKKHDESRIAYIIGDTFAEKIILVVISAFITLVASFCVPILKSNMSFLWLYFIAIGITIFLPDFFYRGIDRMEFVTVPYTVAKLISVCLTFCLIKDDSDILLIPVFEIISSITAVCISLLFLKRLKVKVHFTSFNKWFKDLKDSSIYFISNFATTIFGAFTTIVVGIVLVEESVAYWSVCMQVVSAAKSLYTPISNSIYPHMVTDKDISLVSKIRNIMTVPLIIGSVVVICFGEPIMVVVGGENYEYAGYILKLLLPVIVASFYSMLYGWPVLGAIGKEKETTKTTVLAALVQIIGIVAFCLTNSFNLVSLAICCGVSEVLLFIMRFRLFLKNKEAFKQK